MMDDWKEFCISDIAEVVGGGTPSTKDEENFIGNIPWITPKDLSGYTSRYISHGERNISEKGLANSSTRLLPKNAVLLTTRAPVGYVAIAANPIATNQGFRNLVVSGGFSPEFVYYLLIANVERLKSYATGTTFGELSGSTLKSLKFLFPSLPKQRAIAHILGTLDDKIELNRRMNETLEAMAQALFKSWFVDFDPVRSKAKGQKPTGITDDLASLFPDSLNDSELGKIPKEWKVTTLRDVIVIHDSKRIPLSGRERAKRRGSYPYYGAASVMDYIDDYLFDGVYLLIGEDGSVVNDDDTPVVQYVWDKFWVNNHAHVLTGKNEVSVEYLLLFLKQVNIRPFVTGAVQLKMNQGNLCRIPFFLPPESIRRIFTEIIKPIFARIRVNTNESRTLATIRDALLPKLLSGKIRIKDAEKFAKATA